MRQTEQQTTTMIPQSEADRNKEIEGAKEREKAVETEWQSKTLDQRRQEIKKGWPNEPIDEDALKNSTSYANYWVLRRMDKTPESKTSKSETLGDPVLVKAIPFPENIKSSDLIQKSIQAVVTIKLKTGHASGFIISDDGYILTCFHAIAGEKFTDILMPNKIMLQAEIVKTDQDLDLALLKLKGSGFPALPLGNSDKIQIGEDAFAIGTPASLELSQSVSKGILSGARRMKGKNYIQTDVKVNQGNSGGPLINPRGEVIGIITMKIVGTGIEGLAFSIPINVATKSFNIIGK